MCLALVSDSFPPDAHRFKYPYISSFLSTAKKRTCPALVSLCRLIGLSLYKVDIPPNSFSSLPHSHRKTARAKEKAREEEIMMVEEGRGAPHGVLLAVVVGLVVAVPFLLGDGGEALSEAISELLSPAGLLLLPVTLILLIRFLSSDRGTAFSDIFSFGSPDSIHRVGGSPIGVALVLLLLLVLLYNRVSLFGGDGDSDE